MRPLFASRKSCSCLPAADRKEVRSSAASVAISPRALLMPAIPTSFRLSFPRPIVMPLCSRGVLQLWSHALAQEHRVMALEHPLAGAMTDRPCPWVTLELVDGAVVGQFEQDHVVEVPAVGDVEPANELHAELF